MINPVVTTAHFKETTKQADDFSRRLLLNSLIWFLIYWDTRQQTSEQIKREETQEKGEKILRFSR